MRHNLIRFMANVDSATTHQPIFKETAMNPLLIRPALSAAIATALLAGCSHFPNWADTTKTPTAPPTATASVTNTSQASSPATDPRPTTAAIAAVDANATPPAALKFEDAIARAGEQLFKDAAAQLGNESRPMVIDPLIDANTGGQTVSTARMGTQLASLVKNRHPSWAVQPLTREALTQQPLLLVGTLTPINSERAVDSPPDVFRVWLTLIDLRTGRVVAKRLDRSTTDSVNAEPLPYYRDSPSWHKDKTVQAYINSCQVNTKIGAMADPSYLAHLPAAAVLNEAIMAYGDGKVPLANKLYKEAEITAAPGDLRVLNGLYLTSWQLGEREAARAAFTKLVGSGLEAKRLPVKMLFQPGSTSFNQAGDLPAQYQIWLTSLAQEAAKTSACVKIVGHTSRTGSARGNEVLSRQRAEAVAKLIEQRSRSILSRLSASGAGSKEALVGLGTDDQRDALDRRVEFRVVDCL
jgi:outer membrane protein OmpA-like peptidoglycan-associated protein